MKNIMVYVIIFVVSMALTNGLLYFLSQKNKTEKTAVKPTDKKETVHDTLNQDEPQESLQTKNTEPEKQPEEVPAEAVSNPNPLNDYANLKNLKNKLEGMYSKRNNSRTPREVDSMLTVMRKQVDSLINNQKSYAKKINELNLQLQSKDAVIKRQTEKTTVIEEKYSTMVANTKKKAKIEEEKAKEEPKPVSVQTDKSVKLLAATYNSMDAKKVAQLMQIMPDDKIVAILKKMNTRKVGKILEVMPPERSSVISDKLSQ